MEKSSNSNIIEIVELITKSKQEIDDVLLQCKLVPESVCTGMGCHDCVMYNLDKLKTLEK